MYRERYAELAAHDPGHGRRMLFNLRLRPAGAQDLARRRYPSDLRPHVRHAGNSFVLWLAYGFALGSIPLIAFNILNLLLGGTVLVLKLRGSARESAA